MATNLVRVIQTRDRSVHRSASVSQFRTGDVVEVRCQDEILSTLDGESCCEGLPFMPEMLRFCGQRFRVGAVAHKTCDTVHNSGGRRLRSAVHLEGLRCDGSAHGGCGASCYLFWKDAWLKPAVNNELPHPVTAMPASSAEYSGKLPTLSDSECLSNTHRIVNEELHYVCQATRLYDATEPLPWWDLRQYALDILTGNQSSARVARVLCLAALRGWLKWTPIGYRLVKFFSDRIHFWLTGRPTPVVVGRVARGARTPTGRLNLQKGELVRLKSQAEIEKTLDASGRNRGLRFDAEEMSRYCGKVARVQSCVTKIIEESTGKMICMKEPCIVLEGVYCVAENASCRLNCPRAIHSYWREIWLERVEADESSRDLLSIPAPKLRQAGWKVNSAVDLPLN